MMPNHHNAFWLLLIAALPGCFIAERTYTEKRCFVVEASQKQCRSAQEVHEDPVVAYDDDEVLDVGNPARVVQHTFQCTYAVSIRGINGVPRMPSCSGGTCTVSGSSGLPGAMLPIEHTTITISVASDSCPAPDVATPSLQAQRNDVTLVSVDAPGMLERTDTVQCCYPVTYKVNPYD